MSTSDKLTRRLLLKPLAAAPAISGVLATGSAEGQAAAATPLMSWNDGPAKQAILEFVRMTTDRSNASFVSPEARFATFDQDGTLWVEHPMYCQVIYCLDQVPALVKAKPELANVEPFKTVMTGDREAIAKLPMDQLMKLLVVTLTGMSVDPFEAQAKQWLGSTRDPRWKKLYTELTYQPMLEVLRHMRDSGYK